MDPLILLFLFVSAMFFIVPATYPAMLERMKIDHTKHPTLARYQRIVRARNTKARVKEMKVLERQRNERKQAALLEMKTQHEKDKAEDQAHHQSLLAFWDGMYEEARAPEIAREVEAARVKKELEAKAFEERRVRELAMWEEAEAKRIKEFSEKVRIQNELDQLEKQRVWGELEAKKKELEQYNALAQIHGTDNLVAAGGLAAPRYTRYEATDDSSYGDRFIFLHAVYSRMQANKRGKILNHLVQNERITVVGWTVGEELYGNPIWFLQRSTKDTVGGWVWSGAVSNQSTSGLPRLTAQNRQDWGTLSRDSENAIAKLSDMHSDPKYQLQMDVALLQSEITEIDQRLLPKPKTPVRKFRPVTGVDMMRERLDRLADLTEQELTALRESVRVEFSRIGATKDENLNVDIVDRMTELADANDTINAELSRREETSDMLNQASFYLQKRMEQSY